MKQILQVKLLVIALLITVFATAQTTYTGKDADRIIPGAEKIITANVSNIPTFVKFRSSSELDFYNYNTWLSSTFNLPANYGLLLLNVEQDKQLNMLHYRYRQTINGLPLERTMMIVHTKNNKVVSISSEVFNYVPNIAANASLSEEDALNMALNYMNADSYRWQSAYQEKQLKEVTKDPNATWYPKAELVYAPMKGLFNADSYRLAYKFDIYAEKPVKRNYIYVDALTGEIILDESRIQDVDIPATAYTQYSGIRTMMTSGSPGNYVMSETGRGNGIHTYNNQTNNAPQNVDFVNATTTWNQVNPQLDQYATDGHFGAEKTYDFYDSLFGRNSIDGLGFALFSYVHVQVGLVNAFWDGAEMNYGDGDGVTYTPLTSMEITGHEITHGFTQFTAGFTGGNEPGAMNEGFSDCFGISVRRMGRQDAVIDWLIGDQIGGGTFRDIANPLNTTNPICYQGQNWDFAGQEVHKNSTPFSHCYYLITMGGSGTNEFNNTYNVTALGIAEAEQIWYRMQSVYNMPNSQYVDARTNSIQAATDLYGGCSPEVIAVTNAWYAVNVGAAYVSTAPIAGFNAATSYCSVPATVTFTNTTTNGGNYVWYFGDGDTSSAQNPTHIYLNAGTYTVKLVATSACGTDSVTQTNYIVISPPAAPTATSPVDITCGGIATLTATGSDTMQWFNQPLGGNVLGTGGIYVTPSLNSNTSYYVSSNVSTAPSFCPPLDNTLGAGGNFTGSNAHGEVFTVNQPCTLVSVVVYATGAGNRTINLLNSALTVINTATVNIPNGTSTVILNFPLSVGTGYQLSCGDGVNGTNLYRNTAGAAFPYNDPSGYITITNNDIPDGVHYYYFYNWKLEGQSCVSARTPVNVVITGGPVASFTYVQNGNIVTFTNTSTGSTSWLWNFGDGNTSNAQNPVHTYSTTGTYTVTLTAYNNGCLDSTQQTITILTVGMNTYDLTNALSIYPNPTDGLFNVSAKFSTTEQLQVIVTNTLGQTVYETIPVSTTSQLFTLDLRNEAKGIYFVQLKTNNGSVVKKLVLN